MGHCWSNVLTEKHSKSFFKSTSPANVSVKLSPHSSLNTSKIVIRYGDLEGVSDKEIDENLSSQDTTDVRRIKVHWNNQLVLMNTFFSNISVYQHFQSLLRLVISLLTPLFQIFTGALGVKNTVMVNILVMANWLAVNLTMTVKCKNYLSCTDCKGDNCLFWYGRWKRGSNR